MSRDNARMRLNDARALRLNCNLTTHGNRWELDGYCDVSTRHRYGTEYVDGVVLREVIML